ncbi:alpha/beta hydrolase [Sphaerisporangium album]|uniref:Alpha/beta hydrolase n=1 Tax=Sphaerisporangium album TaxID=509200 RepID=A0A367FRI8_9ACTN|nr:alpha/beta hydrolase [Sphaerisporangium album]RCG32452.1 alpha/beta hydrolase [Sphaerisporangium album]
MRRVLGVVVGVAVPVVLVAGLTTGARGAAAAPRDAVAWGSCPGSKTAATVECATVNVPLDPSKPDGPTIALAVNRIKGSASHDHNGLGVLLVNPGGPGASGVTLARYVAAALPKDVAARYDVIGFDPRGVGASEPALSCVDPKKHFAAPRPDQVPRDDAAAGALVAKAKAYAEACGARWSWLLPHLTTENSARDMDAIRQALGEQKISYLGYSYGTYLGSVYATLFPNRVRRLVLDSVVDPQGVWYDANIAQDYAFDRRHRDFLAWVARHNDTYHLGRTQAEVSAAYTAMRDRLAAGPSGPVGPSELDDIFTVGGYTDIVWPQLGAAFAAYAKKGQADGLVTAYRQHVDHDAAAENNYAVYLAVQCRDAEWPRDWARWTADTVKVNAKAPFMAWANAWYNAPCAFWPEKGGTPVRVGDTAAHLPPILLVQSRHDAATPYAGALRVRARFPSARLLQEGGGNHGVSLGGSACVDRHLAAYLRDGSVPGGAARQAGRRPDATCAAGPEPRPLPSAARGRGHLRLTKVIVGQ